MARILGLLRRCRLGRRAVTSIEYGLIAAVLGALIVNGMTTLGGKMNTAFGTIGTVLTTKASGM
jgi:pilus assembly protein Flp/PilA